MQTIRQGFVNGPITTAPARCHAFGWGRSWDKRFCQSCNFLVNNVNLTRSWCLFHSLRWDCFLGCYSGWLGRRWDVTLRRSCRWCRAFWCWLFVVLLDFSLLYSIVPFNSINVIFLPLSSRSAFVGGFVHSSLRFRSGRAETFTPLKLSYIFNKRPDIFTVLP